MTRIDVDPAVLRKALKDLDIDAPVYSAHIDGDALVIKTREGTDTLPVATRSDQPAVLDEGENCQRPSAPQRSSAGLDDYTAIPGVGPITAQKLHKLGLCTYQDLRDWLDLLSQGEDPGAEISSRTVDHIKGWLSQHLA